MNYDAANGNANFDLIMQEAKANALITETPSTTHWYDFLSKTFQSLKNYKFRTTSKAEVVIRQLTEVKQEIETIERHLLDKEKYPGLKRQLDATEKNLAQLENNIVNLKHEISILKNKYSKASGEEKKQIKNELERMIDGSSEFIELYKSKELSKNCIEKRIIGLFRKQILDEVNMLKDKKKFSDRTEGIPDRFLQNNRNRSQLFEDIDRLGAEVSNEKEKEKGELLENALNDLLRGDEEMMKLMEENKHLFEPILNQAMQQPIDQRQAFVRKEINKNSEVINLLKEFLKSENVKEKMKAEIFDKLQGETEVEQSIKKYFLSKLESYPNQIEKQDSVDALLDEMNQLRGIFEKKIGFIKNEFESRRVHFENYLRQKGDSEAKMLSDALFFGSESREKTNLVFSRYEKELKELSMEELEELIPQKEQSVLSEKPHKTEISEAEIIQEIILELEGGLFEKKPEKNGSRQIAEKLSKTYSSLVERQFDFDLRRNAPLTEKTREVGSLEEYEKLMDYLSDRLKRKISGFSEKIEEKSSDPSDLTKEIEEFLAVPLDEWMNQEVREYLQEKVKHCRAMAERFEGNDSFDEAQLKKIILDPLDEIEKSLPEMTNEPESLIEKLTLLKNLLNISSSHASILRKEEEIDRSLAAKFIEEMKEMIHYLYLDGTPLEEEIKALDLDKVAAEINPSFMRDYREKVKEAVLERYPQWWSEVQQKEEENLNRELRSFVEKTWLDEFELVRDKISKGVAGKRLEMKKEFLNSIKEADVSENLDELRKKAEKFRRYLRGEIEGNENPYHSVDMDKEKQEFQSFLKNNLSLFFREGLKKIPQISLENVRSKYDNTALKPSSAKFDEFKRILTSQLQMKLLREGNAFLKNPKNSSLTKNIEDHQAALTKLQDEALSTSIEAYHSWLERNKIAA